jgi:hypothetical protein
MHAGPVHDKDNAADIGRGLEELQKRFCNSDPRITEKHYLMDSSLPGIAALEIAELLGFSSTPDMAEAEKQSTEGG